MAFVAILPYSTRIELVLFLSCQTVNPWCMVTLLVILSEYVKDVQEIYQVLLTPSSEATAYEIVECLYCISTFLLMFKRQYLAASWNG